ncbi:aldehyde-activating protein [Rhodobacter sp. TJ_12]|uniref:GFA family protein n=1 Tax=Rhodobacter sp. TJ_12 TaxID=2029399 RepID=UPI001CC03591|nr:GFA family protein [Rhodobacter sp. TJ_12]MBZ4021844.1 aldehyde-activating protein [Rhodobacter sp. TJ_12]
MEGSCTCGALRYRLLDAPMIVHCCHCTWCQRETGSAFAVNAMIETDRLEVTGAVDYVMTPSASGKGQEVARCAHCQVAIFSHYGGAGRKIAFVRVGTMADPAACPPDAHIFISTKQPWVELGAGMPAFDGYYRSADLWSEASLARRKAVLGK